MSLQALVVSLIEGIDDPAVRSDIVATIFFLRDCYLGGVISDKGLKEELREVVSTVIDITQPHLLPDEKEKKVKMFVDQMYKAIKLTAMKMRTLARHRLFTPE